MAFRFEELRIYQDATTFASEIFTLCESWPQQYRFTLVDQLIRAALSISLNIAEGSGRTSQDFRHFLSVARGSCYECIPILTIALNKKLLSQKQFESLYDRLTVMSKMITALRTGVARHALSK